MEATEKADRAELTYRRGSDIKTPCVHTAVRRIASEPHPHRRNRIIRAGRAAVAVLLLFVWEVFTRIGWLDPYYWSRPSTILKQRPYSFHRERC